MGNLFSTKTRSGEKLSEPPLRVDENYPLRVDGRQIPAYAASAPTGSATLEHRPQIRAVRQPIPAFSSIFPNVPEPRTTPFRLAGQRIPVHSPSAPHSTPSPRQFQRDLPPAYTPSAAVPQSGIYPHLNRPNNTTNNSEIPPKSNASKPVERLSQRAHTPQPTTSAVPVPQRRPIVQCGREVAAPQLDFFANMHANLKELSSVALLVNTLPNPVSGAYDSVDHYLHVQMQLLRSDYTAALHDGIRQLREQRHISVVAACNSNSRSEAASLTLVSNDTFWVYPSKEINIHCESRPRNSLTRFVVRLTDDEAAWLSKLDGFAAWTKHAQQTAERQQNPFASATSNSTAGDDGDELEQKIPFMNGSLLLFVSNLQLDDLVVAVVVKQKLEKKQIEILPLRIYGDCRIFNRSWILLECKNYFDPYAQVYRVIGQLTTSTFPMKRQLLNATRSPIPPAYLRDGTVYRHPRHLSLELPLQSPASRWPAAQQLGYNDSQLAAIRHALTHRLAIIQGPPGTGKSFVGRELVTLLLHNTQHRIAIVCNSNQALDQFLHALLAADVAPALIVRLGKQSKDPKLQKLMPKDKPFGREIRAALGLIDHTIVELADSIRIALSTNDRPNDALDEPLKNCLDAQLRQLETLLQIKQYAGMQDQRVFGMTSSFAAKNDAFLAELGAEIVIIEEAAEMLETHILAAITRQTQHLIQIGDHKQLRPRTASHDSESCMDVSLFERLHNNRLPSAALHQQHRMHPQLANLVRPIIYDVYTDASTVRELPPVRGMPARLMFMDHRMLERPAVTSASQFNRGEAHLVKALCAYLLLQGYGCEDITVLCTYRAQLAELETKRRSGRCHGCPIAVVDGFQGRESRIVLLSLVRNNIEGRVGFMSAANRACVALTRAREGLFMFGNLQMLAAKSEAWRHVRKELEKVPHGIGYRSLTLRCARHGNETKVSNASEFKAIAGGGCRVPCFVMQRCGHVCKKLCHVTKINHDHDPNCPHDKKK